MDGYCNVRCLFCRTGKEEVVVRAIQEKGLGRAIFPQRMKTLLREHKWVKTLTPLLPGYVFLYSDRDAFDYADVHRLQYVLRVLRYDGKKDTLTDSDMAFADWIWRLNGQVDVLKAIQVGDHVEIVDGVFKQLKGVVTRMDRRRKTVRVELDSTGAVKYIWLAYEIVDRVGA